MVLFIISILLYENFLLVIFVVFDDVEVFWVNWMVFVIDLRCFCFVFWVEGIFLWLIKFFNVFYVIFVFLIISVLLMLIFKVDRKLKKKFVDF